METNYDYDVKEYRPRKRGSAGADNSSRMSQETLMRAAEMNALGGLSTLGGGFMMTTAEMLDFAEGADSY